MQQKSFVLSYLTWHYGQAFTEIWNTTTNFIWALYHFFSVSLLFKTLFSPWRKMDVSYGKGISMDNFFGPLIVNTVMRLVGMLIRSIVIVMGLSSILIIFLLGCAAIILWPFLPLIIIFLLYKALTI